MIIVIDSKSGISMCVCKECGFKNAEAALYCEKCRSIIRSYDTKFESSDANRAIYEGALERAWSDGVKSLSYCCFLFGIIWTKYPVKPE